MSPNPMLRLNSLWLMKKLRCDAQVQAGWREGTFDERRNVISFNYRIEIKIKLR